MRHLRAVGACTCTYAHLHDIQHFVPVHKLTISIAKTWSLGLPSFTHCIMAYVECATTVQYQPTRSCVHLCAKMRRKMPKMVVFVVKHHVAVHEERCKGT